MTQEQKDLLLKDLCARLPYGVKVQIDLQSNIYPPITCKVCNIEFTETEGSFIEVETSPDTYNEFREFLCKPYLFPLSSMTEEEENEYRGIDNKSYCCPMALAHIPASNRIDWMNKHHFDYRGLIPMGLAKDATGLGIY